MASGFRITVNAQRAEARFQRLASESVEAISRALLEGMQLAFRQSQREVPVRTGVLKNSGQLKGPDRTATGASAAITYGGAASAYAQYQHENRTLNHPGGGKAGYVVDPIRAALPDIEMRMKVALINLARSNG